MHNERNVEENNEHINKVNYPRDSDSNKSINLFGYCDFCYIWFIFDTKKILDNPTSADMSLN